MAKRINVLDQNIRDFKLAKIRIKREEATVEFCRKKIKKFLQHVHVEVSENGKITYVGATGKVLISPFLSRTSNPDLAKQILDEETYAKIFSEKKTKRVTIT